MNARSLDTSSMNVLAWRKIRRMRKISHSSRKRNVSWLHGRTLIYFFSEDEEANLCLMVDTTSKDEDDGEEVINLRQSLAKFVNRSKILKRVLKYNIHPYDKNDLGYDKKKEIKRDKSTTHYLNCRKFGHMFYDCRDLPKGPSKPSRTNKKGPNRI
ncbi:hypothetical protein CR513_26510, partial [Mucuna pruriens]